MTASSTTWLQRRRVAKDTAASVAGPAASDDPQDSTAVRTATGSGQRRRKNTSPTAGSPSATSSRNRSSVWFSATVSQTTTLIASIRIVRHV